MSKAESELMQSGRDTRKRWATPRVIVSVDADETGKPFPLVIEGGPPSTYGGTHFGPS